MTKEKKKDTTKKRKKKKNDNFKLLYFFLGVILFLGLAIFFLSTLSPKKPAPKPLPTISKTEKVPALKPLKMVEVPPEETEPEDKALSELPILAIIIDDIGNNKRFKGLIDIGAPLTLAVLPFTPYAKEAATMGNAAGLEIILHLPMEPNDYPTNNPGKGALLTTMDKSTLLSQLKADLEAVPHITGANNHMGSKFTEYAGGMYHVLVELKKRELFFIDSKTSTKSVAFSQARTIGIKTAERSIFLDNKQSEEAIAKQLAKAIGAAKTKGAAIAIGHPYRETVEVLKNILPTIEEKGVQLVIASRIIN